MRCEPVAVLSIQSVACQNWGGGGGTPCPESASELYRPSDRRLLMKLMPTFADRGCHVVSVMDSYGRILGFLDRMRVKIPCDNCYTLQRVFWYDTHLKSKAQVSGLYRSIQTKCCSCCRK
jgi:hypothetical protein